MAGPWKYKQWPNLVAMVLDQGRSLGDRPMVWSKRDGIWHAMSWRTIEAEARRLARGLRAAGLKDGDRVVLVSENRPEWLIADLAVMAAGGITVPAYTTNTVDDHRHILTDSGARAAIVSTKALFKRLWPAALQADGMAFVIAIDDVEDGKSPGIEMLRWEEAVRRGEAMPDEMDARVAGIGRDDTACLIYTSGTGGRPRGVMQTHRGIMANCYGAYRVLERLGLSDEVFLSFLPLSHSYEHSAGQFFPLSIGGQIYYAESADALMRNMQEVRPTIMTAVPRLYEVLHMRILRETAKRGPSARGWLDRAARLGRKRYERGRLGPIDGLANIAAERLVRRPVQAKFGGRLKAMVSGGAPLNAEIGHFFHALGLNILQGYGQTEASPVISCNLPGNIKVESVGPPLDEVEVRIAEDGEILVRGDLLMKGYWNRDEATADALRDGWLHTGDIGRLDADGAIVITDRKKDIIVNSGGDNVSPQKVEGFLTLQPEIGQAMVAGDRRPYLVAVLVPDGEFTVAWCREHDKPRDNALLVGDGDFRKAIAEAVDRVNAGLSPIERVRRFILADEPFNCENGQMTPTMKIRRQPIWQAYGPALEALYGDEKPAAVAASGRRNR
ncbi:MAG: long-chain fatty acid--CoA ligase [Inquilinus sp.]|nr:long-chain fatty acid--CoA ligase [Inquilinus sp.]